MIQLWFLRKIPSILAIRCAVFLEDTLCPVYNDQIDSKKTARWREVLLITELFNIVVNDFDAKKFTRYSRVLVVTELVVSGTQCIR